MILRVRCFGKEDEEEAMLRELKEREDCLVLCCCPSSHVLYTISIYFGFLTVTICTTCLLYPALSSVCRQER